MRALLELDVDDTNGWRTDAALPLRVFGRHRGPGGTPSLCQLLRAVSSATGAADARDGLRYDPVHGTTMSEPRVSRRSHYKKRCDGVAARGYEGFTLGHGLSTELSTSSVDWIRKLPMAAGVAAPQAGRNRRAGRRPIPHPSGQVKWPHAPAVVRVARWARNHQGHSRRVEHKRARPCILFRVIAPRLWSLVEIGNSDGMRRQANQGDSTHDYCPACYNSNRGDCGVYN
jgi:hypothetical protein